MKRYFLGRRMLGNLVVLGLLVLWFITLGPTAFGGPAGYIEVSGHSMDGTYKTGDLILTRAQDSYEVGDIITFKVNGGPQVIHRITGGNGATGYTTQGDNNPDPDPWHPVHADVVGRAWHRFEGKAWMLHLPRRPWFAGATAGLVTLMVLGLDGGPRRRRESDDETAEPAEGQVGDAVLLPGQLPALKVPAQRADSTPAPAEATAGRFRARFRAGSAAPVDVSTREIPVPRSEGPR